MKRLLLLAVLTLSTALALAPTAVASAALPDFVALTKTLKPSVVNISTSKNVKPRRSMPPNPRGPQMDPFEEFFERFFQGQPNVPRKERSLGSGFIISADGYILTNNHVVDGADEIKVKLADGRSFPATIKGGDVKLDLALLKIDTGESLPVAKLGDSGKLQVGEWVIAIGNPFGLEQTVTVGIVSAKGRVIGAGPYDEFIQTDASINPGNSGGPLFNLAGEVIGINTAIIANGQGIGFATPVNAAQNIIPQLREVGHVTRGWLGVSVQPVTEELAASFGLDKPRGALVTEVIKGSPAEAAGFQRGDIILALEGKAVEEMTDLPRLVAGMPVDSSARFEVFRGGKSRSIEVKIGRLTEEGQAKAGTGGEGASSLGMVVTELTPDLARGMGLSAGKGAVVTAVDPAGAAAEANIRPGDLILEVGGKETASAAAYGQAIKGVKTGQVLRLLLQRGDALLYTTLKVQ